MGGEEELQTVFEDGGRESLLAAFMGSAGGMHAEEKLAQMESRERALSTQTFAGRHTVACVRTCLQKLLWRAS